MKIIFLDFDGVMDTTYYGHVLAKEGKPGNDKYGTIFDPYCVQNLKRIIDETVDQGTVPRSGMTKGQAPMTVGRG